MAIKKKKDSARELVVELKDLYLRGGSEMRERGLYHRLLVDISKLNGHVDKDTELIVRIKDIIEQLEKII